MSRCSPYPAYSFTARTFAELFRTYSMDWPLAYLMDASRFPWKDPDDFAAHLESRAKHILKKSPQVDFWDAVPDVLESSLKGYDPKKGPFDRLFEQNLRRRLKRDRVRAAEHAAEETNNNRQAALAGLLDRSAEGEDPFKRWTVFILEQAYKRMDERTLAYWQRRQLKMDVRSIAQELGVSESYLRNRYGGEKFDRLVERAVRRVILDLPTEHLRLLTRHLRDEAGLGQSQIELLVGFAVVVDERVRLLDEAELLRVLGWAEPA
jgi:hypothetical protein